MRFRIGIGEMGDGPALVIALTDANGQDWAAAIAPQDTERFLHSIAELIALLRIQSERT
jgi:hypothetical protein